MVDPVQIYGHKDDSSYISNQPESTSLFYILDISSIHSNSALINQARKNCLLKMIVQGKKCPGNLKNGQSMEIYRFVRNVYKYVL